MSKRRWGFRYRHMLMHQRKSGIKEYSSNSRFSGSIHKKKVSREVLRPHPAADFRAWVQEEFGSQFKCQLCDLGPVPSLASGLHLVDENEDFNEMTYVMILAPQCLPYRRC